MALPGVVDGRVRNLGGYFLESTTPEWTDHIRRTSDCSRLGRQYDCRYLVVCDRIPARFASAKPFASHRASRRNGISCQGGDALGCLLYSRCRAVPHGARHGLAATTDRNA